MIHFVIDPYKTLMMLEEMKHLFICIISSYISNRYNLKVSHHCMLIILNIQYNIFHTEFVGTEDIWSLIVFIA
jgi:hypothetical protein